MVPEFIHKCLNDTLHGLRDGLSLFSGPSTIAVIFRLPGDKHLYVFDPDSLLRGHELKIRGHFSQDDKLFLPSYQGTSNNYSSIETVEKLELDGIITFGGSSATVPYQMWFTEHHPDLSSVGPTKRWLEHAVLRFSHDVANKADLYTGISGNFLREYATHAIHEHIISESIRITGKESTLPVNDILNAVLGISKTREEGEWPHGELLFIPPERIGSIPFQIQFRRHELPQVGHFKHVRKLLQTVEGSYHKLVSDGSNIIGITDSCLQEFSLTADFRGRYGFLRINDDNICSFAHGRYSSSSQRAKLFEVEEALLDYDLDTEIRNNLFHIISTLVHSAETMKHGCTFVLDLNEKPIQMSGQLLLEPIDLNDPELLELACAFSKVDGALLINKDQHLHGFACLLDGHKIDGEDRARGARYNSALRFTAETPNTLVIVVSADRPVSVVQDGIEFLGQCQWRSKTHCTLTPEPFSDWLAVTS